MLPMRRIGPLVAVSVERTACQLFLLEAARLVNHGGKHVLTVQIVGVVSGLEPRTAPFASVTVMSLSFFT